MKFGRSAYVSAFVSLLACIGLWACATQVAPSGGPADKLPPRVAAVYPALNTTNHPEELYVKLEFDEWINASIPRSAVSISPPIEKKMKFEVSGKTLELTSRAVLDTGTTYTVTFAGGIKDLHGNALAQPFQIVFSTGDHIDSLSLAGRVLVNDSMARKKMFPSIGLFLMGESREGHRYLEKYRDTVTHALDSLPMLTKEPPLFLTRADSAGNFKLTGLKPGRYRVVAFVDVNGNQKIEPSMELAGVWTDDLVLTPETADTLWVPLADQDSSKLELVSVSQPFANVLEASFSRPLYFDSAFAELSNCTLTYPDGRSVHPSAVYLGASSEKPQFYFDSVPAPELTYKFACKVAKDSLFRELDSLHAEVELEWVEKPADTLAPSIAKTKLLSKTRSAFPGDTLVVAYSKPVDSLLETFHIVINKDTSEVKMQRIDPVRYMAVPKEPWPTDVTVGFLKGYKDTTLAKADSNGVRDTVIETKYQQLLKFETVSKLKLAKLKGRIPNGNTDVTVRLIATENKNPYYVRCNPDGTFAFENLVEGKYFIDYYYAESGRLTPDGGTLAPFRYGLPWRAPNDTVHVANGENDINKLLPNLPVLPERKR